MEKPSVTYGPELIDKLIADHLRKTLNFSGDVEIVYMHRRRSKKVEATVFLSDPNAVEDEIPEGNLDALAPGAIDTTTNTLAKEDAGSLPAAEVETPETPEDAPLEVDSEEAADTDDAIFADTSDEEMSSDAAEEVVQEAPEEVFDEAPAPEEEDDGGLFETDPPLEAPAEDVEDNSLFTSEEVEGITNEIAEAPEDDPDSLFA